MFTKRPLVEAIEGPFLSVGFWKQYSKRYQAMDNTTIYGADLGFLEFIMGSFIISHKTDIPWRMDEHWKSRSILLFNQPRIKERLLKTHVCLLRTSQQLGYENNVILRHDRLSHEQYKRMISWSWRFAWYDTRWELEWYFFGTCFSCIRFKKVSEAGAAYVLKRKSYN